MFVRQIKQNLKQSVSFPFIQCQKRSKHVDQHSLGPLRSVKHTGTIRLWSTRTIIVHYLAQSPVLLNLLVSSFVSSLSPNVSKRRCTRIEQSSCDSVGHRPWNENNLIENHPQLRVLRPFIEQIRRMSRQVFGCYICLISVDHIKFRAEN